MFELSPRVVPTDVERVPLQARKFNPMTVLIVAAAIAAIAGAIAYVSDDDPGFQGLMGSFALITAGFAPILLVWQGAVSARRIRIADETHGLRFVPAKRVQAVFPLWAALGLLPGLVALMLAYTGIEPFSDGFGRHGGAYGISLISLGWLVHQAWMLRRPRGLTLTEHRLSGVRGDKNVDLPWEYLEEATVSSGPAPKLVLTRIDGQFYSIEPRWIGSDPNEVAAIITYYLEHPEARGLLTDPRAAVRLVEDSIRVS